MWILSIDHLPTALTIQVISDVDGPQAAVATIEADGRFTWPIAALSPATHDLTFVVTDPDGDIASDSVMVDICTWPPLETFDTNVIGTGWMTFGDAHWDPGGWLEITGNAPSRAGSIYRVANKVNPGDFKMTFRIATGGGINSGADGFSVNIVDVLDVPALTTYVNTAANGGCLGYGIVSGCVTTTLTVDAFHVEMDTWTNNESWITDPTTSNHIAINTNGDPGGHQLWASVPTLENLVWRDIEVQAVGQMITLTMDGQTIIQGALPNFSFDGGFIGVSGSTGYATNYHRFDNLQVFDRCVVP